MSQDISPQPTQQPPILKMDGIPILTSETPKTGESSPETKNKSDDHTTIFKTPDTRSDRSIDGRLVRSPSVCSGSGSKSPVRRHLRTMSITSNPSPACNSATNSSRKGINIGISLVGPAPTTASALSSLNAANKEKEASKTPRRKLFIVKDGIPNPLSSPPLGEYSNEQLSETTQRSSIETNNTDISSIINASPTSTTISPPNTSINTNTNINVQQDELSENFRLLAAKEMEVLEVKNQLKYLLQEKKQKEFELQQLKLKIERQLMSNLKQQNNDQYKHRFDQHTPKSPTSIHKSVIKPSASNIDPLLDESFMPISTNNSNVNSVNNSNLEADKRQSWFSRPLNFIQQFDNLIYKEFEKLQIPDEEDEDSGIVDKEINAPIKSLAGDDSASGDVMQSVSQHLWSFVNDVKANLLIEEDEPETTVLSPARAPAPTNRLIVNKSPSRTQQQGQLQAQPNRLRTASISKRQSYSQHNHKRTPSLNAKSKLSSTGSGSSSNNTSNRISSEFTTENINNVVRNISQKNRIGGESSSEVEATELKSGDGFIKDEDLWDSEPLDI